MTAKALTWEQMQPRDKEQERERGSGGKWEKLRNSLSRTTFLLWMCQRVQVCGTVAQP